MTKLPLWQVPDLKLITLIILAIKNIVMKKSTNETIVRLMLWGAFVGLFLGMALTIIVLNARVQQVEKCLRVATTYISELEGIVTANTDAEIGDICDGDGYAEWYSQE